MLPFKDKLVLVTGSGRGIGRAIALHFARQGAHLTLNYLRRRSAAEATAEEIRALGRQALVIKANLGDMDELSALFNELEREWDGLDILINNAASGYNHPVLEQTPKGWDWVMNINARAALFTAQRAAPLMKARGGGAIVNISSPGAGRVLPDYVVVGASKAALEALTRYLAVELAPYNIVVNAVSPGVVATDALLHFEAVQKDETLLQRAAELCPAGRLVYPEDITGVVAFLCSPAAMMIRGQVIVVDGGSTLPAPGWFKLPQS